MKLLNFNIIRLFLFLVLGILLGRFTTLPINVVAILCGLLLGITAVVWFASRGQLVKSPLFAILVYSSMTCIGSLAYLSHVDTNKSKHYTKHNFQTGDSEIVFKITKRLKPDRFNEKYIASILSFNNTECVGQVLINIKSDSTMLPLHVDEVFFSKNQLRPIQGPLNPYQFDYQEYLKGKNIYHQLYLNSVELKKLRTSVSTIFGLSDKFRSMVNERLTASGFKPDVLAIINAMLLGQRQDIDQSIYNSYINSGTIHILAVSGLHVGIILLILNALFKPLFYLKHGRFFRPALIVILLWLFAIVAGLSPSVTRAVTMFSIISIAMHLKRPTNIYNTLAISAFLILLIQPQFLFEVGFQMSYAAVIGIVSIQPLLYQQMQISFWPLDKLWQIFTVTVAAQIGVLPISLFYFHQFPGLFFISNIVVIPFLGLILGTGLFIIVLSLFDALPQVLVKWYSFTIDSLNGFVSWVANFEQFLFRDLPFTGFQVIISYLVILAGFQYFKTRKNKWIIAGLSGLISLQGYQVYAHLTIQPNTFIVFNKSRATLIGRQRHKAFELYHNLDPKAIEKDNIVRNFKVGEAITSISHNKLSSVYDFNDKRVLIVDSSGIYQNLSFTTDYVLLRDSPKINLSRLIDTLRPKVIIVDASNYTSYVMRWQNTCLHRGVDFYFTKNNGAYTLK